MQVEPSRIYTNVDFDRDGRHFGFLRLPHSVHRSAYGWLPIPIISIKNGDGPRVLLISGNHGDEYEGQIILNKLCREVEPEKLDGRLLILPSANPPAVKAGMRTSPLEQGEAGNLNRCFPGNPSGGPSSMIAHYIESVLLPQSDYVFDLHSGGSSLMYLPLAEMPKDVEERQTKKALDLLRVFGAPISCLYVVHPEKSLSEAAGRCGVSYMGTELGGSGTVTPTAVTIGERGVRRALAHIGSLRKSDGVWTGKTTETRVMIVGGPEYYVYSMEDGVFEPFVELGDEVIEGQPAGRIYNLETPWQQPSMARFEHSGVVICKRVPGRTERGDCLFHLATDYAE